MKETIISWWHQLFPVRKKLRGEEVLTHNSSITENFLPEGDNSPIKGIEESDIEGISLQSAQPKSVNSDIAESTMVDLPNIDYIESKKPQEKHEETTETTPDEQETFSAPCVDVDKLVSLTIDSIRYYDQLRSQMPTDDLKTILDEVSRNLIDNLVMSGCTSINEEPGTFNMARHQVIPFQMVTDGTPFQTIKRPGIEYKGEVKLLAIVEL